MSSNFYLKLIFFINVYYFYLDNINTSTNKKNYYLTFFQFNQTFFYFNQTLQ